VFKDRTVVIVGAGASSECDLPTGLELKERISKLLDIRFEHGYRLKSGDANICDALTLHVQRKGSRDINPHLHAGWRIRDAMPQAISIDNFIDSHQGDENLALCGKLAIVQSILEAEQRSPLFVDWQSGRRQPDFSSFKDTWYAAFMQLLTQNCQLDLVQKRLSQLTFVIFNYDRCVENYLYHGLQNYYGIDGDRAKDLLRHLSVFHPYGSVGELQWQRNDIGVEYGGSPSAAKLLSLAGGIKTFTEGTDPNSSEIQSIRQHLQSATTVLFLGFAYHGMNLKLLKPESPHSLPADVRYFGTAFGMSDSDCALVREDLAALASANPARIVLRKDLKCGPFLREYWRSLSLT
jgi:hypothetical protein